MDFQTLAEGQQRVLRMLDQMLGEDDDQYGTAPGGGTAAAAAAAVIPSSSSTTASMYSSTATAVTTAVSSPLFSKNAEGELFLLATNFLLYVALVIVVIIVCRIYFPEALESRVSSTTAQRPRNYNYRVAEEQANSSILEDEDYGSDDEVELLEGDEDVLDSSDEERAGQGTSPNFLEFEQESLSRKQVLQRLIFCCIALNITFVLWGALQVRNLRVWNFVVEGKTTKTYFLAHSFDTRFDRNAC